MAITEGRPRSDGAPGFAGFDFNSPDYINNPYPTLHRARTLDPVHLSAWGEWYLTRHQDAALALADRRFLRQSPTGSVLMSKDGQTPEAIDRILRPWMFYNDPPDHTRLRKVCGAAFNAQNPETLDARVEQVVNDLLDPVADADSFDIIAHLTRPLPVTIIFGLLGAPSSDYQQVDTWLEFVYDALDSGSDEGMARAVPTFEAMGEYFRALVREKARQPGTDIISILAGALDREDGMSEDEIVGNLVLILLAGLETTRHLIGTSIHSLLTHPDQRALLEANPDLITNAVWEFLRYESPFQKITRWTGQPVELDGKTIPEGEMIVVLLGAACRDPGKYPDPDHLDITRDPSGHIGFGRGIHHCLGWELARLETRVVISTLFRRMPNLQLVPDSIEWIKASSVRGLEKMMVSPR